MKKLFLTITVFTHAVCYGQEELILPSESDSPLLELIKNDGKLSFINLSLTDCKLSLYESELDLERKTPIELILLTMQTNSPKNFPSKIYNLDNQEFVCNGVFDCKDLGLENLVVGKDTIRGVNKLYVSEYYSMQLGFDTVTNYVNEYYLFLKDSTIVFEAFKKQRIWAGDLNQYFEGVSINKVGMYAKPLNLIIDPNPASSNAEVKFMLEHDEQVKLYISNQTATVNNLVFSGFLTTGENTVPINLTNFSPGQFTVTIIAGNQTNSTMLIKF